MEPVKTLARITTRKINDALAREGLPMEFVKAEGQGYCYFIFDTLDAPDGRRWRKGVYETLSEMTPNISMYTVEQWVEIARKFAGQFLKEQP